MSKPDLLERALEEHGLPSISAAVFEDGEVTWSQTAGDARPDTQYAIASVTKTFVAAALLELRVDLDEPTRFGTPRQLLSHTSGLQRELPGEEWATLEFPDREEVVARFDRAERILPPGRFHYSNLGYLVLGELVAERAGASVEDAVRTLLLEPQGLRRTTWEPEEPYARGFFRGRPEKLLVKGGTSASGGLWSTAGDLARWGTRLLALEELHRPYAHAGWDEAFGLGVECVRVDGRELWGHEGATVGFRSFLLYDRDTKAGAAVLTNETQPEGLRAVTASLVPPRRQRDDASAAAPAEVEGILGSWWSEGVEHRFRWTGRLESDDAIFAQEGPDRFRSAQGHEEGELLRVVRGEDGKPFELWWAGYPFRRERGYSY
ncbi:MAG: serine hydrolase domain-containing protein [Actinomycetota bacterium]